MSGLMPPWRGRTGLPGGSRAADAQIHSKPSWEELRTMDVAIGLTSCFLCFLLPWGWVLSHLENYKKWE
uniref:Cytochrome c oxidase subunit 8 n=1 Tax=Lynx canadensis TaxID=61383 RepID=A0A667G660_LYNCA